MNKFKITLGQLSSSTLNIACNTSEAIELLGHCAAEKSSLLVLPELYLTGYEIQDAVKDKNSREAIENEVRPALAAIAEATMTTGVDILISYPLFERGKARPYIALDYYAKGSRLAHHRKINLCNYAQYTEHLTFQAGDEIHVAKAEHATVGMFICEDLWHVTNAIFAAKMGAEIICYPSAGTVTDRAFGPECLANWKKISTGTAFTQTSYIVCCNQAASSTTAYMGGSHIVDPNGETILQAPLFDRAVISAEIDMAALHTLRTARPLLKNERFSVYAKYM